MRGDIYKQMDKEVIVKNKGTFVISLDFELFWGVHDVLTKENYKYNILGAHDAVLAILQLFRSYKVHATWAVVGMLYCKNSQQLKQRVPEILPTYENECLSAYYYMKHSPMDECEKNFYFAPNLIHRIHSTDYQEIATHTFSHYYTLEKGQTNKQFSSDLDAAINVAGKNGHNISSIVFPRNQINNQYLKTCYKKGITSYRGNEKSSVYKIKANEERRYIKRGFRFLDRYINLFGHQTYPLPKQNAHYPANIRGSKFLIPYSKKLAWLEGRRLRRVKQSMTYAAKKGEVYHLWWHPHNFGTYLDKNIQILREILEHFTYLQKIYGFRSRNMNEVALEISNEVQAKKQKISN